MTTPIEPVDVIAQPVTVYLSFGEILAMLESCRKNRANFIEAIRQHNQPFADDWCDHRTPEEIERDRFAEEWNATYQNLLP